MAFFNEFPNTRTYDSDLGWLIHSVGKLIEQMESLDIRDEKQRKEIDQLKEDMAAIIDAIREPITDWTSAIEYPIYSMVRYNGDLYSAIQDVPGGISILNTDYWIPSNGLTTLIGQLQTDVINLNNKMEALSQRPSGKLLAIGYKTTIDDTSSHPANGFNIVKTESGKTIFIDFGWKSNDNEVLTALADNDIDSIDVIIISHYHNDHIGNIQLILDNLTINPDAVAYIPPEPSGSWDEHNSYAARYTAVLTALNTAGIPVVYPSDTAYVVDDSTEIEFFNTQNEAYYLTLGTDTNEYNNNSYCCYLRTGGTSVMFTADLEFNGIAYLANSVKHASLMQLNHHGYGRAFPQEFIKNVMPDAVFCNNANGDGGDSELVPRVWNDICIQLIKRAKPIYCTSDAPGYDLVITLNDKLSANVKNHHIPNDYSLNEYSSIALNAKELYGTITTATYKNILKALENTSRTFFSTVSAINAAPIGGAMIELKKTNDGSYPDSFGDQYFNINRFTKYNGGATGEIVSHYYDNSDEQINFLQNYNIGNVYRFNCGAIANGATNDNPNLTVNHGGDITTTANAKELNRAVKIMMIQVKANFGGVPSGDVKITIGSANITLNFTQRYANMITIEPDIPTGQITVTNSSGQNMTSCFVHLIPLAYQEVNLSGMTLE